MGITRPNDKVLKRKNKPYPERRKRVIIEKERHLIFRNKVTLHTSFVKTGLNERKIGISLLKSLTCSKGKNVL